MKAAYINPFVNAVSHLFKTMMAMSVRTPGDQSGFGIAGRHHRKTR